ncbi:MAG: acetate--CoA ligase family protein [Bacteroidota bacterium]
MRTLADKLFRPERVAIVGASSDPRKNNSRPQRFLQRHGFRGEVYPINPGYKELFGQACYPSLKATPQPADHAYVMVPSSAVESVIRECGEAGVAGATIFAGGFAEGGVEGRARQERLVAVAREMGVRLIGPNSLGVINTNWPLTLSAAAMLDQGGLLRGRTAVISQSGSVTGALVSRGEKRGVGYSILVSIGNECDLSVGEIGSMLIDDAETDVILLFLETLREPDAVRAMAAKAEAAGKPVMAYLLGRSELGQALAQSHTGALAGQARALEAFLAANGIMRLNTFESLIEAPLLVRGRKRATGRRVAIATSTGGAAALVADHLGANGIEVAPARDDLRTALAGFKIDVQPDAPILDLTMAGTRPEVVDTVMQSFMADERVDAIVVGVGSTAVTYPELVVAPLAKWAKMGKPIVSFLLPDAPRSLELLAEAGIAGFRTPEACADALQAYLKWQPPQPLAAEPLSPDTTDRLAAARGRARMNELAALELFQSLGIPVPRMAVLEQPEAASWVGLTFPVVAKVLSPDILHKSDVGGVVVGIGTSQELAGAAKLLLAEVPKRTAGATIDGILVQEQAKGVSEAIVGFRRDPLVGPIVVVGVGGVLAEVYADVAIRPAPVDEATARAMIAEVKGFAAMRGFRGLPEGDLDALAKLVAALSRLALAQSPEVTDAEINPVIIRRKGEGAIAVDGIAMLTD